MIRGSAERGITLVEILLALVLLAGGILAVLPLFVQGTQVTAASADMGTVGAEAVRRMEVLRRLGYVDVVVGGSVTSDVTGYFEDRNGTTVRWAIAGIGSPPQVKTITVRAIADRDVAGLQKETTLVTMRSR